MVFAVWHLPIRRPTLLLNNSLADAFWFRSRSGRERLQPTRLRGDGSARRRPHPLPATLQALTVVLPEPASEVMTAAGRRYRPLGRSPFAAGFDQKSGLSAVGRCASFSEK